MKTQQIIAVLAVIAILAVATFSQKPNPDLLRFEVEGSRAYGYGFTDDRSVGVVKRLMRDHPEVDTLVLHKMSGTQHADANLKLARRIRKLGLNTHVDADSIIASGAVDLFLAGVRRSAECGAKIGVHAWSVGGIMDAQDAYFDDRKRFQENFLRDMGVDPDFYVFTREAAPAADIYWLTPADMTRFGVLTDPNDCG
ncbi:alpha/beta hydrolase [Litorimonas sp. RW-G-Af-16]|uniref:COG3904 family protein n=1 Tax=Litorimonas sp. RW-G-Af-16 TaxID=3241168 RepID=UPI00390CAC85